MAEDIWNQLLMSSKKTSFQTKNLLILGDLNCGKSNLLAKLQGLDQATTSAKIGLEYSYIDLYAEDDTTADDPMSRIDIWQLEGEVEHKDVLIHALNETNIEHSAVVICLDFTKPWELVTSLKRWLNCVREHISSLNLDPAKLDACKKAVVKRFQEYTEAEDGKKRTHTHDQVLPPLPDGVLVENLGVPIIVVCCKVDAIDWLESEFGYKDSHFEFIQQYLRRICLKYGAALIYTSVKKDRNCDLVLDYLQHVLYDIEFLVKAQVIEKDSIFVPIGWDSMAKIEADFENQKLTRDPNEEYEKIIPVPPTLQLHKPKSIVATAEDDQAFLQRSYIQLQTDPANAADGQKKEFLETMKKLGILSTPSKTPAPDPSSPATTPSTPSALATPTVVRPTLQRRDSLASPSAGALSGSQTENDMLANFFNSLLSPSRDAAQSPKKDDAQLLSRLRTSASSPKLSTQKLAPRLAAAVDPTAPSDSTKSEESGL